MSTQVIEIEGDDFRYHSLGERVADIIRTKITHGEFPPGTRLGEDALAKSIGISRSCVREAFYILEREGLISRRVRNKYTEVVTLNERDVGEIFTLRCALEILAAEICVTKGYTPLDEIRALASQISDIVASRSSALDEYVDTDFRLHEAIIVASGHSRVIESWNCLARQMQMLMFSVINKNPELIEMRGVTRHADLVRALESGDMSRITETLREHILGNVPLLIRHVGGNATCERSDSTDQGT